MVWLCIRTLYISVTPSLRGQSAAHTLRLGPVWAQYHWLPRGSAGLLCCLPHMLLWGFLMYVSLLIRSLVPLRVSISFFSLCCDN